MRRVRSSFPTGSATHPAVIVAALVIIAFGASALRNVIGPLLLAALLVVCLSPFRTALVRRGVRGGVATAVLAVALVLLLVGFASALFFAFAEFVRLVEQYSAEFDAFAMSVGAWLSSLGFTTAQSATVESTLSADDIIAAVSGVLGGAFSIAGWAIVLITALILLAVDAAMAPALAVQMHRLQPFLVSSMTDVAANVRLYMVATAGLGAVQGVVNGCLLLLLGVPGAFLAAVLSFLCAFIPNVGYFIAIIPALVFGAIAGGVPTVIAIIVIYSLVNTLIHSIIGPRVVGNAVALSPALAFAALLVFAAILGPIGALLAIPLTLVARALLIDANPRTRRWRPLTGDYAQTRSLDRDMHPQKRARGNP